MGACMRWYVSGPGLCRQAGQAVARQQAIQSRGGGLLVDELPGDHQEIVQRQQEGLAQGDDDGFLGGRQGGVETMGGVGTVFHRVASLPMLNHVLQTDNSFARAATDRGEDWM